MTTFPPIESRRGQFDVNAWRQQKHTRKSHTIFTHYHPWGPCTNQHCTVLKAMKRPPPPPPEPYAEDPLISMMRPQVTSDRQPIDPAVITNTFDIGGAGAVLRPQYRKRNFLGLGGMPYDHKVLFSTRTKAQRQKGSCFVENLVPTATGTSRIQTTQTASEMIRT